MANNATPSAPVAGLVLLPCPFCGETDTATPMYDKPYTWIECEKCLVQGPVSANGKEARERWNRRAANRAPALLAALEQIANEEDESNEWDAVEKFARVREIARAALAAAQGLTTPEPHA